MEQRMVDDGIGPAPELAIGNSVRLEQLSCHNEGLTDPPSQTFGLHAVLGAEYALLVELAHVLVRLFGGVLRYCASLLRESQIWIARSVRFEHSLVAGQLRGDPEFLLVPVDVSHTHVRWWLN